jgi:GcrA cell cycle regulator
VAWTAVRVERLKKRWSQGVSARKISKEFGGGVSRSAVLGKIHRLGIAALSPNGGASRTSTADKDRRAGQLRPRYVRRPVIEGMRPPESGAVPSWVTEAKPYVEDPRLDAHIPLSQRRALLELDNHMCRWPIGEPARPDFLFCGAQPLAGKPYCAAHCVRAFRPTVDTAGSECVPPSVHVEIGQRRYRHRSRLVVLPPNTHAAGRKDGQASETGSCGSAETGKERKG